MKELEAYQHLSTVRFVALLRYGTHHKDCPFFKWADRTEDSKCNCGLSDVLGYGIAHALEAVGNPEI